MPFGQYRGKPVSEVPDDYLAWVLRTCHVGRGLRDAIAEELHGGPELPPRPPPEPRPEAKPVWAMAYYTCTSVCCFQPGFWTMVLADQPPALRCPGCGSGAEWRGWAPGLGDMPKDNAHP
jgi:hypothetical protein